MIAPRALAPLAAAAIALAGALAATFALHRTAAAALDRVLEERLRGAGETAAELLARGGDAETLRGVMRANELEGAYLVSPSLRVLADATGPAPAPADLLRVDAARVARALGGEASIAFAWSVADVRIATGYFPIRGRDGRVEAVLGLEAGQSFLAPRDRLRRALWAAVALAALGALALAALARQWARGEAARAEAAERAARGDAMARMAAMAAHEIRNPIGIIRGAVELMQERGGPRLAPPDREALGDVLGEVERLRRLTQDFLDLAREPALVEAECDLARLAADAAQGLAHTHPGVAVELELPPATLRGDEGRLRQVVSNLLQNAAEAGAGRVKVSGEARDSELRLRVADDGPGIAPQLKARLFEPFATGRAEGTGLGLALSRRIVARHGGSLELAGTGPAGTTFELRLPLRRG
ncbi:sensor histidine kinase [Anaeromyxobacter diazotrophicus]|uniref:histidine kinase n=1 Tax=Anaeromyxobacter diazotrophicus TaxID=2590199 RepID=A0A7I9VRR3_9BACT|nr:HAMP domain-containing sensor histidine kinase [Anaeromyxobacter diazotrophicus]GEJ59122.1 hypothetical protein AMYX_38630 [Anaeromyxobacter diazotrophicus]